MSQSQQQTIKKILTAAREAERRSDTAAALGYYIEILQLHPENKTALKALQRLQSSPTKQQLDQLVRLYQSARMSDAEQMARQLIQHYPRSLPVLNVLGAALLAQNRLQEAVQAFDQAIQVKPDFADAYSNRGAALMGLGQLTEALASYEKATALKPKFAGAHYNCGLALQEMANYDEALVRYDIALQCKPDYSEAHNNRGAVLLEVGRLDEAVASYRKAIEYQPDYALAHSSLCSLYEKENRIKELKEALRVAQQSLPANSPDLLYSVALLANAEKRYQDACDALEKIIPDQLAEKNRQRYAELLAKSYDKLKQCSQAFSYFEIANTLSANSIEAKRFSAQNYFDGAASVSQGWVGEIKANWEEKYPTDLPFELAFLVGFPRSGTTLLDTILRSHPDITVLEELPMVGSMSDALGQLPTFDVLDNLNESEILNLRNIYFRELSGNVDLDSCRRIVIDKMPLSLASIGLIHRIFPESKFILSLRHPCDCVLSCFMQTFQLNDAMANFLSLEQSARLYDVVMRLYFQYQSALDIDVFTLKYENLVQDLKGNVEPLLEFLSLPWDDEVLNYRKTALDRGRIHTPSYNQVTQELYTAASYRWQGYREQMVDVLPLLEPWAEKLGYTS